MDCILQLARSCLSVQPGCSVAIAEDVVTGEPLTLVDVRFSAWLQAHHQPDLDQGHAGHHSPSFVGGG